MDQLYSIDNAKKFQWSSITGKLNAERISHLENYLVGQHILDAGCGGGAYVEFLSRKGLEVIGIDKYEEFLEVARQEGRKGDYVQADLTNIPFPDKSFDCTYCFDVLEHIDDELAIKELTRVTTQRLIIAVPHEDQVMSKFNLTFLHYQDKTHLRNYTEESLRKLISGVNYSKIVIFPELAIPSRSLVLGMMNFEERSLKAKKIYQMILRKVLHFLLARSSYQKIYTSLVAIVDLSITDSETDSERVK